MSDVIPPELHESFHEHNEPSLWDRVKELERKVEALLDHLHSPALDEKVNPPTE